MIDELKPCPFCGSTQVYFRMMGDYPNGDPVPAILCSDCHIIVKYYDNELNNEQIFAAWNYRVNPEAV